MNIAIIKPTITISSSGGVKQQALMWKKGLEDLGHNVHLINFWDNNEWKLFDVIMIIEYGGNYADVINHIYPINPNIISAPIIDTNYSVKSFHLACKYLKVNKLRLHSRYNDLYKVKDMVKLYLVRSEYEKEFITKGLGLSDNKTSIIPLSYRFTKDNKLNKIKKENFCLHVSLLYDKRKNVDRLIKAAIKYRFNLKLGGKLRNKKEENWLESKIKGHNNIEYIGFLTDNELCNYYQRAKVFALPSTYEGVGMVALEASLYGCDIVITNLGGPKEYYNNMAFLVNPYDIDDIGKNILMALEKTNQPQLYNHITENYNLKKCMEKMIAEINKRI